MKSACKALVAISMVIICATAQAATCKGKFANPITDDVEPPLDMAAH